MQNIFRPSGFFFHRYIKDWISSAIKSLRMSRLPAPTIFWVYSVHSARTIMCSIFVTLLCHLYPWEMRPVLWCSFIIVARGRSYFQGLWCYYCDYIVSLLLNFHVCSVIVVKTLTMDFTIRYCKHVPHIEGWAWNLNLKFYCFKTNVDFLNFNCFIFTSKWCSSKQGCVRPHWFQ